MTGIRWYSGVDSHAGNVRERNEDATLDDAQAGVWVVADGMGGHAHGDQASRLLVSRLRSLEAASDIQKRIDQLADIAGSTNLELWDGALGSSLSGTTLVVLAVAGNEAVCLWVGDSRAYRLRQGTIEQLTEDHCETPGSHVLTRAIGSNERLDLDFRHLRILHNDRFVLCTDGLYSEVGTAQIAQTVMDFTSPQQAATRLVTSALSGKCPDNATALVVHFEVLEQE